jgi:hypothetical protein
MPISDHSSVLLPKGSVTMTKKILGLMATFLLLSACNLFLPATPNTSQLETSVFQTLTAMPSLIPQTNTPMIHTPPAVSPTTFAVSPTSFAITLTNTPVPTSLTYPTPAVLPPTAVPVFSAQIPDQFIRYYYSNLNQRNYQRTWSLLSDSFKYANNGPDQGGFLGYANFWDTVKRVDIFGVTVTSQSGGYAVVNVNMQYTYKNGVIASNLQTFNLIYDYGRGTWLFNSFTPITTPPPPPIIVQTPTQFINNYFANINAGNYSLTWSLLTDRFKTNANHNSYDDYTNFWTTVTRVDITSVSLESQTGLNAVVTVYMVFNYRSGLVTTSSPRFYLIYNSGRSTWLFDSPF